MTEPHVAGFAIIVGTDHHPLQRKQINMNKLKPEIGDKLRLTTTATLHRLARSLN
jgi:hypothetical protein